MACILVILVLKQTGTWLNIAEEMGRTAAANEVRQRHERENLSISFYIFLIEILVLGVNISGIIIKKWEDERVFV